MAFTQGTASGCVLTPLGAFNYQEKTIMRIVYVEDNPANIALVQRICQMSKDELITYSEADSALDGIEKDNADLILMDVNLGQHSMNGLELTSLLRQKGIKTPIIIVTAYDTVNYPEQFEATEYDDYMPKPVSIRNMLDLINSYRPTAE
jgi:CheY-like chemotaxis protein